jgi:hypothetical protein
MLTSFNKNSKRGRTRAKALKRGDNRADKTDNVTYSRGVEPTVEVDVCVLLRSASLGETSLRNLNLAALLNVKSPRPRQAKDALGAGGEP